MSVDSILERLGFTFDRKQMRLEQMNKTFVRFFKNQSDLCRFVVRSGGSYTTELTPEETDFLRSKINYRVD